MKPMAQRRSGISLIVVLVCASTANGQTLNTIYSFGHNVLGRKPLGGVLVGAGGELYGTLSQGGASGIGAVYELLPPPAPGGAWTEMVLHSFSPQVGDGPPTGSLTIGPQGALYGVTSYNNSGGQGTVFQLLPPTGGGAHWRESVLHVFDSATGDGVGPTAPPVLAQGGTLYGTTSGGGVDTSGIVYRLTPSSRGGAWAEKLLYEFLGKSGDGISPSGTLVLGKNLTLYGATEDGGAYGGGMVFMLEPPAAPGAPRTEKVLHSFGGSLSDPFSPVGITLGPDGVLYGATVGTINGRNCSNGCGTVFQLSPPASPGGDWTETILYAFRGVAHGDGSQPNSPPIVGKDGVLYGTTSVGGAIGSGTVYELIPPSAPGESWTEVVLYSFTGGADGLDPLSVTLGPDGNLYGTTALGGISQGGITNQGTVFQLILTK